MLMPAGNEFNGCKDVLQFKLIQAAKEKNKIQNNNFTRNVEKFSHMDDDEMDRKHMRKRIKQDDDYGNSRDYDQYVPENNAKKWSIPINDHHKEKECDFRPRMKISSHHKKTDFLPVSKNRKVLKSVRSGLSKKDYDNENVQN